MRINTEIGLPEKPWWNHCQTQWNRVIGKCA
jgi:hypothetical protein